MRKRFVIDTNVILFDPQAIFKFQNADVIIPISVIEEMDRFKKDLGENGRNARQFSRFVDVMRSKGALSKGVLLEKSHSYFFVNLDNDTDVLPDHLETGKVDNRILALAIKLQKEKPPRPTVLITKDTNLRIKADVLGIIAEDYEPQKVDIEDLFSGLTEYEVSADAIDSFYSQKTMPISDSSIVPNQYIIFKDVTNPNHSAIARYNLATKSAVPLIRPTDNVWGIYPRNVEQSFALDCLLNDEIKLVSLVGKAGTGKTLLALAAGLSKTLDEGKYHRLLVSRPIFPMGRDIGYLPGDVEEKLNPWMQPVFDNIEYLLGSGTSQKRAAGRAQELISQGMLNIEPLTYIRGRSIPNQYLIVDEAQNLTPHEIKTIITRAGQGTKVVLTGDCYQIDNPYVDSANNGLTYVVERFKGEAIAAHVTLSKGERSELAELAANLL
ncbi:MAG: PhoH family protein [Oligoflexia bacterium]|nr:PhoH family protein [Oligoflexia bacterium]